MKKGEFIYTSKRMVKEYVNRYIEGVEHVTSKDIQVIGFNDELGSYRILLSTPTSEEYYGVSYDKGNDKLYSYIYKKIGQRIIGKKNKARYYNDYEYSREDDEE